jgi:hypothetical protein
VPRLLSRPDYDALQTRLRGVQRRMDLDGSHTAAWKAAVNKKINELLIAMLKSDDGDKVEKPDRVVEAVE